MYRYLALYSTKYTNLTDIPIHSIIVLHRKFIFLLQRDSLKDVKLAGLVHMEHLSCAERSFALECLYFELLVEASFLKDTNQFSSFIFSLFKYFLISLVVETSRPHPLHSSISIIIIACCSRSNCRNRSIVLQTWKLKTHTGTKLLQIQVYQEPTGKAT